MQIFFLLYRYGFYKITGKTYKKRACIFQHTLLNIDRAVPEVWGSKYDVRELLRACYYAVDRKSLDELPLTFPEKQAVQLLEKKVEGTDLEILLKESGLFK